MFLFIVLLIHISIKLCRIVTYIQIFLATYGTAGTLPLVLAGKCEDSTCTTLTTDLDVVKACFTDPTDASNCRGKHIIAHSQTILLIDYKSL